MQRRYSIVFYLLRKVIKKIKDYRKKDFETSAEQVKKNIFEEFQSYVILKFNMCAIRIPLIINV